MVKHTRRRLKLWAAGFVVWLAVMVGLLLLMGADQTVAVLANIDAKWLLAAVGSFVAANVVYGLNWNMLIRFLGMRPPLREVFRAMMIGFFIDDVLPTITPGGEFMMGYVLHKKSRAPLPKCLASVVAVMISWFVGFIVLAAAVLATVIALGEITWGFAIPLAVLLAAFSVILIVVVYLTVDVAACERVVSGLAVRLLGFFSRIFRKKRIDEKKTRVRVCSLIRSFHCSIEPFIHRKRVMALSFATMTLHHLLNSLAFWFMVLAFNVWLPVEMALLIIVMTVLVSLISLMPGGLGPFEIVSISLLSLTAGLVPGTIIGGVFRLMQYWSIVFGGGLLALETSLEEVTLAKTKAGYR